LALADAAGVTTRVANLHYRGDQLAAHLRDRNVALSWETEQILETGGGLRAALPLLGPGPVLTLNSDAVWTGANPLQELMAAWDAARMDALLLLLPVAQALGHSGSGDFLLDAENRISRAKGAPGLVYSGAQIIRTGLLEQMPEKVFSLNLLWDKMILQGRAFGMVHQGGWCDVGRPDCIPIAEALLHV